MLGFSQITLARHRRYRQRALKGCRAALIASSGVVATSGVAGTLCAPGEASRKIVLDGGATAVVVSYGAERPGDVLGNRRSRYRGTSARAYHEESANDRSDSSVSRVSAARRKEGRKEGIGRKKAKLGSRTIGFRVHAYSSARGIQKWVNPTQRPPFSRHSVAYFHRGRANKKNRDVPLPSSRQHYTRLVVVDNAADRGTVCSPSRESIMDSLGLPAGLRLACVHRLTRRPDVAIRH